MKLGHNILLSYPSFNEIFIIHTDAIKKKLGGVISQNGNPITFYSRKLNPAQINYTTTNREALTIVETIKCLHTILLGNCITVYTYHKSLTFEKFTTERVLRWRLFFEEYGPEINILKGLIMT